MNFDNKDFRGLGTASLKKKSRPKINELIYIFIFERRVPTEG
jgi:hypothetical protein